MTTTTNLKIHHTTLPERDRGDRLRELGRALHFNLPETLSASEPPEARGMARDQVRLMVSYYSTDKIVHTQFRNIVDFLDAGDVLVLNTSGTMPAALHATRSTGEEIEVHLSTRLPAELWVVELRKPGEKGSTPFFTARQGETLALPRGATLTLLTPHHAEQRRSKDARVRLWIATVNLPTPVEEYLAVSGFPIRYSYVREAWPISYYQTVYATEPGSAEMPSAGRGFTQEILTRAVEKGVSLAPLILHTGVASLEEHEPPYEEYFRVPTESARLVNEARAGGGRVIAVGTTSARALETVTDSEGIAHPGHGWTTLVITPSRGMRAVSGMLTGLHEPAATHLAMLEAVAGRRHLQLTYRAALEEKYLWHEFGDLHLILP